MAARKPKSRRLDYRDLLHALYWNDQYRRDYSEFSSIGIFDPDLLKRSKRNKISERVKSVGLEFPISPDSIPKILKNLSNEGYTKADYLPAVQVKLVLDRRSRKHTCFRERRYLCVEIDITAKKEDITTQAWALVQDCKRNVAFKREVLQKKYSAEQWEVYAQVKNGKTRAELAREKSGQSGHPTYNPTLEREDKRVRALYNKAEMMVKNSYPLK